MIVNVCADCLPSNLDSFDGPEDARECVCCGRAMLVREVHVGDAIRALLGKPAAPATEPAPPPSSSTPGAPAASPKLPALPGLPPLPSPGAGQ